MRTRIGHFGCKACGGTLGMKEGERIVTCSYCGVNNLVDIEDHIPSYVIKPEFTLAQAKKEALALLREKNLAADLASKSQFYDAGLYYLPVFEMTGVRSGKMQQTETKKVWDGFKNVIVEVPKATIIMADVYFKSPAIKISDWGVENIPLEKIRQGRKLHSFDPGDLEENAMVFSPNLSLQQFESEKTHFEGYLPGDQTRIINKQMRILYCPVWLIKYSYHGRLYRIVIDAVLGEIVFARAPASDLDRIPQMIAVTLLCVYPLGRALRFLITSRLDPGVLVASGIVYFIPLLILISIALSLVAFAWNQFRYASDAVWRGQAWDNQPINKPPETALERVARNFSNLFDILQDDPIKNKRKWDF